MILNKVAGRRGGREAGKRGSREAGRLGNGIPDSAIELRRSSKNEN